MKQIQWRTKALRQLRKIKSQKEIDNKHRTATLVKLAKAMGVSVDQLKD